MNDKQLSELEEILLMPQPVFSKPKLSDLSKSPAPTTMPPSGAKVSTLSHITNLPSGMHPHQPAPIVSRPVVRPPQPQSQQPKLVPHPAPVLGRSASPTSHVQPSQSKPTSLVQVARPKVPLKAVEIQKFGDIQTLAPAVFRTIDPLSLISELQRMVRDHGYFAVLYQLEHSPLYSGYIDTGKFMLQGKPIDPDEATLSKEEFESFADVLRQIRVN